MLRKVLTIVLSIALVTSAVPTLSAGGSAAGQISGIALSHSGRHLGSHGARLRSLDAGDVVGITTTNSLGEFSFAGLSSGSFAVELVSGGYVVGTSTPVVLSAKAMTATGVMASAPDPATQAQAGAAAAASFWASTAGVVTLIAIGAGIVAIIVAANKQEASPSR